MLYRVGDPLDVGGPELVVLSDFHKALGRVNEQHVVAVAALFEHHDDGWDAGAEEDIGRQANDRVDVVLFDQVLSDRLFQTTTEQDAVRQDNGHHAVGLEVEEVMEQEGVVCFACGCQSKAGIPGVGFLVGGIPVLGIGWVRHDRVHV